jgi:hypothetical protein
MRILVPESFFDLGEADLSGEAEVLTVLMGGEFGHRRDFLTAGIAGSNAVSLHKANGNPPPAPPKWGRRRETAREVLD